MQHDRRNIIRNGHGDFDDSIKLKCVYLGGVEFFDVSFQSEIVVSGLYLFG